MSDRLHDTLSALRTDVDHMPLADSSAVRARGTQRTRRQAIGTSLAVVALVAGAVGISGTLTGDNKAENLPATRNTTTAEQQHNLAVAPFLAKGDLTGIGPYGSFQDSGQAPDHQPMLCIDVAGLAPTATKKSTVLFEPDIGDATVHEHVLRFPDEAAAKSFFSALQSAFKSCDPGDPAEATITDRGPLAVGTQGAAVRASRLTTPKADAGIGYYEVGAARNANVIVVLEWSSMGNPEGDSGWVLTEQRLATALEKAVA